MEIRNTFDLRDNNNNPIEYSKHEFLRAFHTSDARIRSCCCGRRGAKTTGGEIEDIYWLDRGFSKCCNVLTEYDEKINKFFCPQCNRELKPSPEQGDITAAVGLLVVPTFDKLNTNNIPVFTEILGVQRMAEAWKIQAKELILPRGHLYCATADKPASVGRGGKYHFAHYDEVQDYKDLISVIVASRPSLSDYKGKQWFTWTPKGKDATWKYYFLPAGHIYTVKDRMKLEPQSPIYKNNPQGRQDMALFNWRTIDNPRIDKEEVLAARKDMIEAAWRAEFFATVESYRGLVYPDFLYDTHVVEPHMFDRDDLLYVSIDVGWNHPTAVLFSIMDKDKNVTHIGELYETKKTVAEMDVLIKEKLKDLKQYCIQGEQWEPVVYIIDPASKQSRQEGEGISSMEQFQRLGYNIVVGENAVVPGISLVTQWLRNHGKSYENQEGITIGKLRVFSTLTNYIEEKETYRWKENNTEGEFKDEVIKEKDDLQDAERYLFSKLPEYSTRAERDWEGKKIPAWVEDPYSPVSFEQVDEWVN